MADYRMRGWQNDLLVYHYWKAGGAPDWTGAQSGYPEAQIDDAIVVEVIPTSGVEPGQGGGDWDYPGMSLEEYNPPALALADTDFGGDNPGFLYTGYMAEGDPSKTETTLGTSHWNTGDLTDLMSEYP